MLPVTRLVLLGSECWRLFNLLHDSLRHTLHLEGQSVGAWRVGTGDRFSTRAGLSLGDLFLPFCVQYFQVPVFHAFSVTTQNHSGDSDLSL